MNDFSVSPRVKFSEKIDLKPLNEAIRRNDYETIIKSEDLFWNQFGVVFSEPAYTGEEPSSPNKRESFYANKINDDIIQIEGTKIPDIKKLVEELRKLAKDCLETRSEINYLFINHLYSRYLTKPSKEVIDVTNREQFSDTLFKRFIEPYIVRLFASVKIECIQETYDLFIRCPATKPRSFTNSFTSFCINDTKDNRLNTPSNTDLEVPSNTDLEEIKIEKPAKTIQITLRSHIVDAV